MKRLFIAAIIIAISAPAYALSLIDTAKPEKKIQTGVRIGLTSSNLTNNYDAEFHDMKWKNQHWGNGFLVGGVVDFNIVGCFTVQPGAYFYRKANTFNYLVNNNMTLSAYEGRQYTNVFQVPVLMSFRIGVAEIAQLQLDFGPYVAWSFGGKVKYTDYLTTPEGVIDNSTSAPYLGTGGISKRFDTGIKTGVGVLVMGHVYLGAHFNYGIRNTLQNIYSTPVGGHSKVWQFTIGYNF